MSIRVLILVEGQTEERFVKDVLALNFYGRQIFFQPTILMTKRVKAGASFKGGTTNYAKFRNDAKRLLAGAGDALVTTMLDYYRLPSDFPGMTTRPMNGTPLNRVIHVEKAIARDLGEPSNFVPFLALHEFEAWLFSSPEELPRLFSSSKKHLEFQAICASVATPEEINERPELAPYKRIANLFPSYRKTLHGPTTAARIGLARIRQQCPHFNDWISRFDNMANLPAT